MDNLSNKQIVIAAEEDVFCPVSYVRLIGFFNLLPESKYSFIYFNVKKNYLQALKSLDIADGLIMARNITPQSLQIVKNAKHKNIPVIFEIDDYLWHLPTYLSAGSSPKIILDEIISLSDVITTPSNKIKEHILKNTQNKKIIIIPNSGNLLLENSSKVVFKIILANSDVFRLPSMQEMFFRSIRDVAYKNNIIVHLYYFSADVPHHYSDDPHLRVFWMGIRSYSSFRQILSEIKADLALVPLPEDEFSLYKSVIKFAEFSFHKIPIIFSKVDPYLSYISENKDGLFAENSYEGWFSAINKFLSLSLIDRHLLAENSYQRAIIEFSAQNIALKWDQLIEDTVKLNPNKKNKDYFENLDVFKIPKDKTFNFFESYAPVLWKIEDLEFRLKKSIVHLILHKVKWFLMKLW